jgi:hypothetical protein
LVDGPDTHFRLVVIDHPHTQKLVDELANNPGPIDVVEILTEAEATRMATELDCLPEEGSVTPETAGRLSVERRDLIAWAEQLGF